jgi:hypothetical protein
VPAGKWPWPAGIGHQASARASRLIEPAPRRAGDANGAPPSPAGLSVTSTQSSTSAGDTQSRSSRARIRCLAGTRPVIAVSSGTANSSKTTAVASG